MTVHPTASVHPTAVVEDGARIGADCVIGPFAIVGPEVVLARRVVLKPHSVVTGWTEIGEDSILFSGACVGEVPQDLKFSGERTRLVVGRRNKIREAATLNCGTEHGGGETRVGDDCLFMTGSHVGHDCIVGNRVVMANHSALGGHCRVGDDVTIGGLSGIHQRVRIGNGAFIGAIVHVNRDIIPYAMVQGTPAILTGLNLRGLRRRDSAARDLSELRSAFEEIFEGSGSIRDRARSVRDAGSSVVMVNHMVNFILEHSDRSLLVKVEPSDDETR